MQLSQTVIQLLEKMELKDIEIQALRKENKLLKKRKQQFKQKISNLSETLCSLLYLEKEPTNG